MAGIFQPVHNDEQGGVPVQQPIQPGVTGGLTQTSGLFAEATKTIARDAGNYFASTGSGGKDSVFDKKTAILRPIFKEIDKFSQLREKMGVNFRPQFNKYIRNVIAENPMLHQEISNYAIESSGIDVGGVELDPLEAAYQAEQAELKDPKNYPRALRSLTLDKKGNHDYFGTISKYRQLLLRDKQDELFVEELGRRVKESELTLKEAEIARDEGALELLPRHRQRAQESADGFINSLVTDPTNVLAQQNVLTEIESQITVLRNEFSGEAGSANIESSGFYDTDKALEPLIALRDFYIAQQDNMQIISKNLEALDKTLIGEVVRKATGLPIGAQKEFIEIIAQKAALGHRETIEELLAADSDVWSIKEYFSQGIDDDDTLSEEDTVNNQTNLSDPNKVFSKKLVDYVSNLDEGEQEKMVSSMFTLSLETNVESLDVDETRKSFVNKLAVGVASARAVSGDTILDNKTLKSLYNSDFSVRFNKIVGKEDIYANRAIKIVNNHFASVLVDRSARIEKVLKGEKFEGVYLRFDSGRLKLTFDLDHPSTPIELKKKGVTDFDEFVSKFPNNPTRLIMGPLLDEVTLMNETAQIVKKLNVVSDNATSFLSSKYPVDGGVAKSFVVETQEEFDNAPSGARIIFKDSEGNTTPMGVKP